jgi:hypothetical protein
VEIGSRQVKLAIQGPDAEATRTPPEADVKQTRIDVEKFSLIREFLNPFRFADTNRRV